MFSLEPIIREQLAPAIEYRNLCKRRGLPLGAYLDPIRTNFKDNFQVLRFETPWVADRPNQDMRDLATIFAQIVWSKQKPDNSKALKSSAATEKLMLEKLDLYRRNRDRL